MAKQKTNRIYDVGDHFYEHQTLGGQVIAALQYDGRHYILVHREDDIVEEDTFSLYYQDLKHKMPPALTRRWPGAILEQLLEVLRDYRRTHKSRRPRKLRPVQPPTPEPGRDVGHAGRSVEEDDPAPAATPAGRVPCGDIGLCL